MSIESLFDNQRLSSLLEAVDAAVITINDQGKMLEFNSATSKLFGYSAENLLNQNVKKLMPSPYHQEHDGYLENYKKTGVNHIIGIGRRVEGRHASGKVFPIHLSVASFKESGNTYYTGIIHDLTELALAEAASLKLERIIDECINEVFTFHRNSMRLTGANQAACRNLGYSLDELKNLTPQDIVFSLSTDALRKSMDRLRNGDEHFLAYNETFKRKDGSAYEAEVQLYYLDELNPPEFATIAMDVTSKNRMMESLRQSQKMESIGNLTGGIAHDFNNILTVVLGNAELLQLQTRNKSDNDLLKEISEAAKMGSRLTSRLLAFARRKSLSPEIVNLNELITDLYEMLTRMLDNPIDLILSLSKELAFVSVDVSEIENALVNLVVNAKDAMPDGGKVAIETTLVDVEHDTFDPLNLKAGRYVRLSVSDTGHGVDALIKDTIFEPFVSTKSDSKGTGLGLSMVYGFVKQSGGHINCYSEHGLGTTFNIYLPRAEKQAVSADLMDEPLPVMSDKCHNILIAEDDDHVRRLSTKRLEMLGHTVIAASNGFDALKLFRENPSIELVFSDVVMTQGMTGYDLALEIRKIRPETPILLTSGYAENILNPEKLAAAGLTLLRKPYEQNELIAALEKLYLQHGF